MPGTLLKIAKTTKKIFKIGHMKKVKKQKLFIFKSFSLEVQVSDLSGQKYANGTGGIQPRTKMNGPFDPPLGAQA